MSYINVILNFSLLSSTSSSGQPKLSHLFLRVCLIWSFMHYRKVYPKSYIVVYISPKSKVFSMVVGLFWGYFLLRGKEMLTRSLKIHIFKISLRLYIISFFRTYKIYKRKKAQFEKECKNSSFYQKVALVALITLKGTPSVSTVWELDLVLKQL